MSRKALGSVVVIDDDVAYLNTVAFMLSAMGFEQVAKFENGFDAIDYIEDNKPDLVVSDWDTPSETPRIV